MSGVTARRGFAFQDLLLADRVLEYATRARACDIDGSPRPPEPQFGVEASGAASDEGGPEWDLLEQHPEGNVWLEEVKRGQMDADDRKALWLRVRAQFHQLVPDERETFRVRLIVNSEKPPHVLTGWQELGSWVTSVANSESVSRFLESPARPDRVRDAADLAQEAIYYLTCTSGGESLPLDARSTLGLLRTFQLQLEPASKIAARIERRLSELTDNLAIDTLLDCLRGAISRRAEGVATERVFRPSQLLAGFDVLKHLMTVDQRDIRLWCDLRAWSRASQVSPGECQKFCVS